METVRIGLVGPSGADKEERNPAASMYLHDMVNEMSQTGELNRNPFELHWVCERLRKSGQNMRAANAVPQNVVMEPTWTSRDFVFTIPWKLRKLKVRLVHIHHEPFLFGYSVLHSLAFIIMLCLIRILSPRSRLILIMACIHEGKMPEDMARQSPLPASITNIGFHVLYRLVLRIGHAIMVAKESQKDILVRAYGAKTDAVYAVLSYTKTPALDMSKNEARRRLGLDEHAYVILNFGCLSYYKGLEELLPAFYQELTLNKEAVLVIAGGPHPRLSHDGKYYRFEQKLKLYAKRYDSPVKRAIFTGWVPGEMVPVYFAAADIAVMPYTCHIASSAVLYDAISYEVPIVITRALTEHPLLDHDAMVIDSAEPRLIASKITEILTDDRVRRMNLDVVGRVKEARLIRRTATQMIDMYKGELRKLGGIGKLL